MSPPAQVTGMDDDATEMESRAEIIEIRAAAEMRQKIETEYKENMKLARARNDAAARGLNSIANMAERLRVISYAYNNTAANKHSLAWAYFEKENYCWHLRRVMRGPKRTCVKCEQDKPTSYWNFDWNRFLCETCYNSENANRLHDWNEQQRVYAAKERKRQMRIDELREASKLSHTEMDELIGLLDPFI